MTADTQPSGPSNPQPAGNSRLWAGLAVRGGLLLLVIAGICVFVYFSRPDPPPVVYSLTVENGSGSGAFPAGTKVSIAADSPPPDQIFDKWTITAGGEGGPLSNPLNATTTLTMPSSVVTVAANYKPIEHRLTVMGGAGSGAFPAGTKVSIAADSPPPDQTFDKWTIATGVDGGAFFNPFSMTTTLTMASSAVTVAANYKPIEHRLTVKGGAGSGAFPAGTKVSIAADSPPADQTFDEWTITAGGEGGPFFNPLNATTTLTMPRSVVIVAANYKPIEHRLTVKGGSGSGAFAAETMVSLSADSPRPDQVFVNWTTEGGGSFLADTSLKTTFVMPRNPATVTANFVPVDSYFRGKYTLESGKTMYEIDSDKRRFSYSILIGGRFRVQTEILPYDVLRFEKAEGEGVRVIEISGEDNQTVSASAAALRLTRILGNDIKLERIKPLGGDLGVFKRQP